MTRARQQINILKYPDTFHFNIGNIGAPSLGAPGVATPAAMSYFGQINISSPRRIQYTHIHIIVDGAAPGALVAEIWRRRSGVMTLLTTMTYTAPAGANFVQVQTVPATAELASLRRGDYLYAQAVTGTNLGGGWNGLTLDVHYAF